MTESWLWFSDLVMITRVTKLANKTCKYPLLICQLKMWGESATMMEFKAEVKRPVFLWERTNFFNKYFHRTSTDQSSWKPLRNDSFLHNLIAWSMQYALQTFYLGKVDFLSVTDVSPGITWIETRKLENCRRIDKRKQESDTTMWQKDSTKRRVKHFINFMKLFV